LGGHAGGDQLGNLRGRPQGFGAAKLVHVERPRHGVPGELSLCVGWGRPSGRPLYLWRE